MAEPIPQPQQPEIPKPTPIVVGETPIYLTKPATFDGTEVTSLTILSADKRAVSGVGSAVPLVSELSRKKGQEGQMVDKPLTNLNSFDELSWDNVSGIQWIDKQGDVHVISKEQLSLEAPSPAPAESADAGPIDELPENQETAQPPGEIPDSVPPDSPAPEPKIPAKEARDVLESITEDPNTITIVGLKAYETRALTLADRKMQLLTKSAQERANATNMVFEKSKDRFQGLKDLGTSIWKQSIGGIYFHEKSRQYYLEMLKAAETPFAEDAIRMAERRATDLYNEKMANSNFLVRVGTKTADWLKDKVGMRTSIQTIALSEIASMKDRGEIQGMATLEREAKAVRLRFGQDFDRADQFVRSQLGEKLEILHPDHAEHRPLIDGIQTLLKQYASGDIPDKTTFDQRVQEFFNATLKQVRPDIFAEAELYSSSLFDAAETLRTKMSHEGGLANIDEALSSMQIRLGLGQMGEVTSMEPTAVERGVGHVREVMEWLNKKNVLVPMVFNEATIGSAVAIALSAANFVKTMPASALVPLGGGALAGGLFAGWREYGQLQKDYMTHLREREAGATFTESQKRRAWFEKFAVKQRGAAEMINTMQSSLYESAEGGEPVFKTTLTDDELRSAFATIADTQARKAVSETGLPVEASAKAGSKRIGLIQYSNREAIESERAALDITASRALSDLDAYIAQHQEQAQAILGGNTFDEFMVKLTTLQTHVLREGVQTLTGQEDVVASTLNLVSGFTPEAHIVKRRWPFASSAEDSAKADRALGIDAILEEFNKEAKVEAVKYGIKAGAIGAGLGAVMQAAADLGQTDIHVTYPEKEIPTNIPAREVELSGDPGSIYAIGKHTYQAPKELLIHSQDENGRIFYDARINLGLGSNLTGQPDAELGTHMTETQLRRTIERTGMDFIEPHKAGEAVSQVYDVKTIPGLLDPRGQALDVKLPDGFDIKRVGDQWQILDDQDKLVTNLRITNTGEIEGGASAFNKLHKELMDKGYEMRTPATERFSVEVPTETAAGAVAEVSKNTTTGTMDLRVTEGGLWNHFASKVEGTHPNSSTNVVKNLFRLHEYYDVPHDANGLPTNIEGIEPTLRPATYGGVPVQELDIAKLGADARVTVPKALFSDEAIANVSNMNDRAIARLEELMADGTGAGQALETLQKGSNQDKIDAAILQLGYFGRDADLPTEAELAPLLKELGSQSPVISSPDVVEPKTETVTLHRLVLSEVHKDTVSTGAIVASGPVTLPGAPPIELNVPKVETTPGNAEFPWLVPVLAARMPLEAVPETMLESPLGFSAAETLLSPVGGEGQYLDRKAVDERKSPRLKEHAMASLNQKEEIDWYLAQLGQVESQTLEALKSQENPPINPAVRAVLTLPVSHNQADSLYSRLSAYSGQTNADGTPLDPSKIEYIVYNVHMRQPVDSPPVDDLVKAEVDRFLTDHAGARVVYITHAYDQPPTNGQVKRDVTNFAMSRIHSLPDGSADVTIISDNGTGTPVSPLYFSSVIDAFDANPALDVAAGSYTFPKEAYEKYPMLFAQHRAFELFDGLVRHGEADNIPGIYSGNMAARASTMAAVGSFDPAVPRAEDRHLSWMITKARGTSDTIQTLPAMTSIFDPRDVVSRHLKLQGVSPDTYKDLSWQEMATKANESYTKEQLEADLATMYNQVYPTLKSTDPKRFDAYFSRTLDALGIKHELVEGTLKLGDISTLQTNMATELDTESFTKQAAGEIVAATPTSPETPREALTQVAGPASTEVSETAVQQTEEVASSLSSPDLNEMNTEAKVSNEQSSETETLPPETQFHGMQDRIEHTLKSTPEQDSASVQVTPKEFMDYVQSSVELPGARISDGTMVIEGNSVKLVDMKAKTLVGEGSFEGTLVTDPTHGLVINKESVKLNLPLLAKPWESGIHGQLDKFSEIILKGINNRIPPGWHASRIDIVGEKLEVKFEKNT